MNTLIIYLLTLSLLFGFISTDTPKLKRSDVQLITGQEWTGTLTYLDYSTGQKVSIPSNLIVSQSKVDKFAWVFDYEYPDELEANSSKDVLLSKDGRTFNGENVVEREPLNESTVRAVTEKTGTDNDQKALFRFTYLLASKSFSIKKEVRYEGAADFIERNQYSWAR